MKVDIYNTEKKYDIIYADPPWAYHDTLGGNAKMGAMPYPTMTNEEICAMPIGNKIAKKGTKKTYESIIRFIITFSNNIIFNRSIISKNNKI